MKKIEGLTSNEVALSHEKYGTNELKREKSKGFFSRFFENLSDPIIRILLIALSLQVLLTLGNINYVETVGIVAAILLSTTVSTLSEYRSERAFLSLEAGSLGKGVKALRDGSITQIPVGDIAVGDVIYLNAGERIEADGRIILGKISVDQSALNGESAECHKSEEGDNSFELSSKNRVFRGSVILEGSAVMKVERVGTETYFGMVARDVQTETRESPLKRRLSALATQISRIGYAIAAVVGFVYLFSAIVVDNGFDGDRILASLGDYKALFGLLVHTLTLMITVVVVAAPEGLPMMITVVLSANMKKMLSDKILVKKLVGIETAGSMNILFTDKTGTLTEGRPMCDKIITASGIYKTLGALKSTGEIYSSLLLSAKYNTDVIKVGGELGGGNATDRGIYEFFDSEAAPEERVISKTPFSSELKYSSVRLSSGVELIKGAAERILSELHRAKSCEGGAVELDREYFMREYYSAVRRGERVIAVAEGIDGARMLVGLIVMKDKLRKDVKMAVKEVTGAGIQTVMLTGDSRETAIAIASECGIYDERRGDIALTSDELATMSDSEIKASLPKIRVLARSLPQDKTRLVRISQEENLVVGMTGDGINDAPSLKLADVGFSMGSGTEIAKSASDIVVLDNSFSAISKTVLYGRTIFKSIRKFITFQLIMNLCASGVSLLGQLVGIESPITIIQMLWVNIIMDTLGGLAFAGEPALSYYMKEIPVGRDEPILSRSVLSSVLSQGAYTLILCVVFLTSPTVRLIYGGLEPTSAFYTAFYALFIFSGIFNCFAARCERLWILSSLDKNKPFILIMLLISIIQLFMIYFGGSVFRCVPLTVREVFFVLSLAFTVIPFDTVRRIVKKLK
jgi:calcium-translocating P-type ATPase